MTDEVSDAEREPHPSPPFVYARVQARRDPAGRPGQDHHRWSLATSALLEACSSTGSDSRAWALYNLGNLYLRVGTLDTAAFIYNGILEERPGYANAYNGLAKLMVVKGNYKQGVDYFFTASQISPDLAFID